MSRRDKLTIAQGLLVGLQGSNATLAMMHGELYITVAVAAVVSAGQYIVHQMALDTDPKLVPDPPASLCQAVNKPYTDPHLEPVVAPK